MMYGVFKWKQPSTNWVSLASQAWAASLQVSLVTVARWSSMVALCCTPCYIMFGSKAGRLCAMNSPQCHRRSLSTCGGVSGGLANGDASVATPFVVVLVHAMHSQSSRGAQATSVPSMVTAANTTSQALHGSSPYPRKRLM